jgi:vacuolar protein-sorting-associated protein 4
MDVNFLDKAIPLVQRATEEDQKKNYREAFQLYEQALKYFLTALKYEKNERLKATIRTKTAEYMERAEQLKQYLKEENNKRTAVADGEQPGAKKADAEEDDETSKMRKALESAIVSEKPNVRWSDVAGLEGAKESLKEAVILPIKFPQLFVGKRKPWRGILLYGVGGFCVCCCLSVSVPTHDRHSNHSWRQPPTRNSQTHPHPHAQKKTKKNTHTQKKTNKQTKRPQPT